MTARMLIKRPGQDTPEKAFPQIGLWYEGQSERGTGAIAKYQGWNTFTVGDDTEVDMTIYDYLVEHPPKGVQPPSSENS